MAAPARSVAVPALSPRLLAVALLSVGLAFAGWALERACQVPPDDDSGDAPGADRGGAPSPR